MLIETERLLLREYTMDDFDALFEIMSDEETMKHYPSPFDKERTRGWITWNIENYSKYGFGLWAVVLKETNEFIGDCGITIQDIDGEFFPEIGYHIHKKYWRRGYGTEVLDYLDGDEAGIKSVTVKITGMNAYGYLRSEKGVHRLVRISPFNAAGKRQTSFASCDVMPDIKDDIEVEIADEDIQIPI